jgi:hypothetical protein
MELISARKNIKLVHVPYPGSPNQRSQRKTAPLIYPDGVYGVGLSRAQIPVRQSRD